MKPHIAGLSILGGDPTASRNIETVIDICRTFKEAFPEKSLWVWSGFKIDMSLKDECIEKNKTVYHSFKDGSNPVFYSQDLFELVDVVVDGRWEIENYDPNLLYAGSSNQRLVDMKKTLAAGEIVEISNIKQ